MNQDKSISDDVVVELMNGRRNKVTPDYDCFCVCVDTPLSVV
jgi:hypothetical protein